MKKHILLILFIAQLTTVYSQVKRMSHSEYYESTNLIGFLGRGASYTGGWKQMPSALTLTYHKRDFAIGGWGKSNGEWNGASLFINSDSKKVGVNNTDPKQQLDVNGIIRSSLNDFFEGSNFIGFLGRGNSYTGGWKQIPNALTLTYHKRDFAIGGWGKSNGEWNGASLFINSDNGYIGLGTTKTKQYRLAVEGIIGAREIVVNTDVWPDFVFKPNYKLKPLNELESFINKNSHLPNIPSEQEVKEKGINLGSMDVKLLQKIEELTLYIIQQNKKIEKMQKQINKLKK